MKQLTLIYVISCIFCLSCSDNDKDNEVPEILIENISFQDGFETESNNLNELFVSNGSRWSTIQQTDPSTTTNEISVVRSKYSEGESSLRIVAYESDQQLSKMDIEKNGLKINPGDKVTISVDVYIVGDASLENVFLIDLECCSCWDPKVGDNYGSENQCPGIRLMMSGGNDFLSIERGKIGDTTIQQTDYAFPRDEWVHILWEMTLSDNENGDNRLQINSTEVISQPGMNLPNAEFFRERFAEENIDFSLKQPLFYERVQVGVTANPTADDVELYIDNFSFVVN